MANSNTVESLLVFIKETLKLSEISRESQMGKVKGWDSLRHLKLITSLEKKFDIEIPIDEIANLVTVNYIITYLSELNLIQD